MKNLLIAARCSSSRRALPAAAQTDYIIGSQDVLTITVFGEAELSGNTPSSRTARSRSR